MKFKHNFYLKGPIAWVYLLLQDYNTNINIYSHKNINKYLHYILTECWLYYFV